MSRFVRGSKSTSCAFNISRGRRIWKREEWTNCQVALRDRYILFFRRNAFISMQAEKSWFAFIIRDWIRGNGNQVQKWNIYFRAFRGFCEQWLQTPKLDIVRDPFPPTYTVNLGYRYFLLQMWSPHLPQFISLYYTDQVKLTRHCLSFFFLETITCWCSKDSYERCSHEIIICI